MVDHILPNSFYRVSIKALILDDQKRFLLVKNSNDLWDLPGGGIDFGETPEQCLRREIQEEMGLEIVTFEPNPIYFYTAEGLLHKIHVANVVYKVTLASLKFIPSDECEVIGFFTLSEAEKLETYPKTKEFLKLHSNHGNL